MMDPVIEEDLSRLIKSGGDLWEQLAGKSVLVTGAGGMVPFYFVAAIMALNRTVLKGRECTVLALVRNREKAEKRFSDYLSDRRFRLLVQDVCAPITVEGPVDYIIHAASQASPKYYSSDPVGTMLPNTIGTRNLLDLARQKNSAGFLFVSGGEVYGIVPDDKVPTKESDYGWLDPMNVRSCYAESKRAGETMCVSWHKQYGVPASVARLAHTYGPGLDLSDGRVFADFVRDVLAGRDIEMNSDGSATRAFCYVSEAVWGMFLVLLRGERGMAYNVCNDSACVSILELARTIASLCPPRIVVKSASSKPDGVYMRSPIIRSCLDSSLVRALGWVPRVGIRDGFARTLRSFDSVKNVEHVCEDGNPLI